jgi:hypothetical protein
MAAKKKPAADKRAVGVSPRENEDFDTAVSRTYLRPTVTATLNLQRWSDQFSNNGIRSALAEEIEKVAKGEMSRIENILLCQAHTLDFLFGELAQREQCQQHMPNFEAFMRMALKAQSQCRTTLETLANIKNPPVVFAKQANINHGNQQVNNLPGPGSRAEKTEKQQNELLVEAQYGGTALDTGATGTAIPVNSHLEALEKNRG